MLNHSSGGLKFLWKLKSDCNPICESIYYYFYFFEGIFESMLTVKCET